MTARDLRGLVTTDSGEISYRVLGSGAPVLLPWCNLDWPAIPIVARLAEHHRVVLASPLGFQASSGLDAGHYGAARVVEDLLTVCDALDVDDFAVFGYSLSAAVGAWLATTTTRVNLAVVGGFPLLGSHQRVLDGVREDMRDLPTNLGFDPAAALAFYRDLAGRPDGMLVRERRCPMRAFVGTADEVLDRFAHPDLVGGLRACGVDTTVVEGTDHVTTILATDDVMGVFLGSGTDQSR
jgi:pimeloyl-ACP methyl ester carboxylesterase